MSLRHFSIAGWTALFAVFILVSLVIAYAFLPDVIDSTSVCTAWLAKNKPNETKIVVALKSQNSVCYIENGSLSFPAPASFGRHDGAKEVEGDGKTPEGRYLLHPARDSRKFGKFLWIDYPHEEHKQNAARLNRSPGGDVGLHGPQFWYAFLGRDQARLNHSDGCIVVDEDSLRQMVSRVNTPTPMLIVP